MLLRRMEIELVEIFLAIKENLNNARRRRKKEKFLIRLIKMFKRLFSVDISDINFMSRYSFVDRLNGEERSISKSFPQMLH